MKINYFILLVFVAVSLKAQQKVLNINVGTVLGQPKELLSVNIGPDSSLKGYQECGIKQIRAHDYSGPCDYWTYTVNSIDTVNKTVTASFNPRNTASYIWTKTDEKIDYIVNNGFVPFFRLGISWPGSPLVPTFPPIDISHNSFSVFASICKHTVMHYTGSWSNGRTYAIPYWEIWNEPDLSAKFWTGPYATPINFYKMYREVSDSIKAVNPQFKVGGPGLAYGSMFFGSHAYRENFITYCKNNSVPLDFYSWHLYDVKNPYAIKAYGDTIRNILDNNGFTGAKSFITEIHPDLEGTSYNDTPKGAVWLTSAFIICNSSKVDNFFWYRGTNLGALVNADKNNTASLRWNGYAYKAYSDFFKSTKTLIQHDGDETTPTNFTSDENTFLTIAGKSATGDTISILISNLKSSNTAIEVHVTSIPWNGDAVIEQYAIRTSEKYIMAKTYSQSTNGSLTHTISNAASPCSFLIRIYKKTVQEKNTETIKSVLTVSPNPANNVIKVHAEGNEVYNVFITNTLGQKIITAPYYYDSSPIDISSLSSGIYFISNGASTTSFIKK